MKNLLFIVGSLFALVTACDKQKTMSVPDADSTAVVNECTQRIIHAHVFLKKERVAEFIDAARNMIDSSNMEPGCISYQLFRSPYDETNLVFVEVWKDQAAIDAHFKMPYFLAWGPKTEGWYEKPTELKIFNAIGQ
jgi:quinol monooxygenase YgiN